MLGEAERSPVIERDERSRTLAIVAAVLLAVGGLSYWWLEPAGTFSRAAAAPPPTVVVQNVVAAPVMDEAGVLSDQAEAQLTAKIVALKAELGPEMTVLTVATLKGQSIEAYALTRGNRMGIGDRERDDGILIVVAPKEHKVRIEVGRGLTSVLSNATCAKLIDQMLPQFKAGKFDAGVAVGVDGIDEQLHKLSKFLPGKAA